jgi:hypothetical protein
MQALRRIVRTTAWRLRALWLYMAARAFPQPTPAWWQRYPRRASRHPRPPAEGDRPQLADGTLVRLTGRPGRQRRVLQSTWHWHRHGYVYVVETSARPPFEPYWFLDQLLVDGEQAVSPVGEDERPCPTG